MRAYLNHVLRRTLFVLGCLGTGLLGWPGITGAQETLRNFGHIDASGARRITVTPSDPAAGEGIGGVISQLIGKFMGDDALPAVTGPGADGSGALDLEALAGMGLEGISADGSVDMATALRDLPRNMAIIEQERDKAMGRAAAFGAMMGEMDRAQGEEARAKRLKVEAAKAARPKTPGETLFAEFGFAAGPGTPYDASRAELASRR